MNQNDPSDPGVGTQVMDFWAERRNPPDLRMRSKGSEFPPRKSRDRGFEFLQVDACQPATVALNRLGPLAVGKKAFRLQSSFERRL